MADVAREHIGNGNVIRVEQHASWTKAGAVVSHLPDDEIVALEERAAATIGDSSPLGWWSFATGTWILGTVIGGAFAPGAFAATVPVLLALAGLTQFIAGLFAYRKANTLAATAFCSFGALYVVLATVYTMQLANLLPPSGAPEVMLGFLLESFGFIALALTVAAMRTNAVIVSLLGLLTIGYVLAGIPLLENAFGQGAAGIIGNIGGWFLVASAFVAYYAGMAHIVNSTWKRTALPIGGEP